jgi:hypothetical protein
MIDFIVIKVPGPLKNKCEFADILCDTNYDVGVWVWYHNATCLNSQACNG